MEDVSQIYILALDEVLCLCLYQVKPRWYPIALCLCFSSLPQASEGLMPHFSPGRHFQHSLSISFIPLRVSGVHGIYIIYKTPPCLLREKGEDITEGLKGYATLSLSAHVKETKRP